MSITETAEPERTLTNGVDAFDPVLDRLTKLAELLEGVRERVSGPLPHPPRAGGNGSAPEVKAEHLIGGLYLRRQRLATLVERIEEAATALARSI